MKIEIQPDIHIWITRSFALASPHLAVRLYTCYCVHKLGEKPNFFPFFSEKKERGERETERCQVSVIVRFYSNVYWDLPGLRLAQCETKNRNFDYDLDAQQDESFAIYIRAYNMPIKPYDTRIFTQTKMHFLSSSSNPRFDVCDNVNRKNRFSYGTKYVLCMRLSEIIDLNIIKLLKSDCCIPCIFYTLVVGLVILSRICLF